MIKVHNLVLGPERVVEANFRSRGLGFRDLFDIFLSADYLILFDVEFHDCKCQTDGQRDFFLGSQSDYVLIIVQRGFKVRNVAVEDFVFVFSRFGFSQVFWDRIGSEMEKLQEIEGRISPFHYIRIESQFE